MESANRPDPSALVFPSARTPSNPRRHLHDLIDRLSEAEVQELWRLIWSWVGAQHAPPPEKRPR